MVFPTCSVSFSIIVCRHFSKWQIKISKNWNRLHPPPHPLTNGLPYPQVRWYPIFFMKMAAKDVKEITYMPLVTFLSDLERPGKTVRALVSRGLTINHKYPSEVLHLPQLSHRLQGRHHWNRMSWKTTVLSPILNVFFFFFFFFFFLNDGKVHNVSNPSHIMSTNSLSEPYQSAYKPNHGTETLVHRLEMIFSVHWTTKRLYVLYYWI